VTAESVAALIAAILLLLVPGGLLAQVAGLRGLWWLAAAPVGSVAVIAATAAAAAPLRLPFAWWEPVVVALVIAAVVTGVRALRRRRILPARLGRWTRREVLTVAIVLLAAIASAGTAAAGIGSWNHVSQTYDGVFHLNAVAWIQATGDGSSFDLYRMTHPGTGNEFYPAAWHDLVASVTGAAGAGIPVATNAVWVAMQVVVWMPGIALLAATVAPARHRALAASLGALAAVGLVGFPDLLLAWGTLYPTALAYALLPFGLVLAVRIMRWIALAPTDRRLPAPVLAFVLLGVWLVASALAHPRSLFGWVVLAAPLVVIEGCRAIARIWRVVRWRRRLVVVLTSVAVAIVAVAVVGGVYVYRTFDLAHRPISDHLNGGPATANQGLLASFGQAIGLAPPDPNGGAVLPVAWLLAALVLVGAVLALLRAGTRWLVIAWALAILLYVLAAGSNSDLAKLATGLWYKDKFRLFALLPIVQTPLVALVGVRIAELGRARIRVLTAAIAAVVVGAASLTSNAVGSAPAMVAQVFAVPAQKDGHLLDADELRLLERLPQLVPAGQIVAGDPWDGSALSWAIGDRRALFPHLTGVWTLDQWVVAAHLDQVRTDPAVCSAVHRLGVRWVVEDPDLLWGGSPDAAPYAGFHRAVAAGVLEPVAHEGSAGLYRIPACTG
jgi:hypothetical protein